MKIISILLIILVFSMQYANAQVNTDSRIIKTNTTTFLTTTDLNTTVKRILSPSMNEEFKEEEYVMFSCCGITGDLNEYTTYLWKSDIDGIIGKERYFSVNNLSVGRHYITLRIYGREKDIIATDSVTITINKESNIEGEITAETNISNPFALIELPYPYPGVYYEGIIEFRASAIGGNPPYSYRWVSGIDGFIGDRKEFNTGNLSIGSHEIFLNVRDSKGLISTKNITLVIIRKSLLNVSITSPKKNGTYIQGDDISLEYSVSGGRKPYTFIWTLDNKSRIGRIENISLGRHEITVTVKDADNNSKTDIVEIDVIERCNRNNICDPGENYFNCPKDCSGSLDGYCDKLKDGICDPDCSRENDIDCLCNNNGICEIGLENYANCPKDCKSGSKDGYKPQIEYSNYLILLILIIFIIIFYFKVIKKRG